MSSPRDQAVYYRRSRFTTHLPADHPQRQALIDIIRFMTAGYAKWQDPATGRWFQLPAKPTVKGNWTETSCSSMYTYTLSRAVEKGYVDASYKLMLESALRPEWSRAVRVGVASHNLFDVAWALVQRGALPEDQRHRIELEMLEGLEQLRFLAAGIPVDVVEVETPPFTLRELNNPEDVEPIEAALAAAGLE